MSVVRAAGGVPVRDAAEGLEVLVVHRPAYGDWTFPKGKCEPGESDEACALREVEEETGLRCALEAELPSTGYADGRGRDKVVRYWRLRVVGGASAAAGLTQRASSTSCSNASAPPTTRSRQ